MCRMALTLGLLMVLFLGLAVSPSWAKGRPDKLVVNGPGLMVEIETTDPAITDPLGMAMLEDVQNPISPPSEILEIYVITRLYQDQGAYYPFDQVLYVPNAGGDHGFVYYVGINNGAGPYDGKWYPATPEGERVLLDLLSAHGVRFDRSASLESSSSPVGGQLHTIVVISIVVGLGILFLAIGWYLGRSGRSTEEGQTSRA